MSGMCRFPARMALLLLPLAHGVTAALETLAQKEERAVEDRETNAATCVSGAVMVVVCICFVLTACTMARQQMSYLYNAQGQGANPKIISSENLEACFPPSERGRLQSEQSGTSCAVCLAPIEEGESCRWLQCGHMFHAECIMEWWTYIPRRSVECPLCRQPQRVPAQAENLEEGASQSSIAALQAGSEMDPAAEGVEQGASDRVDGDQAAGAAAAAAPAEPSRSRTGSASLSAELPV